MEATILADCSHYLDIINAKMDQCVVKDFKFKVAMSASKFESYLSLQSNNIQSKNLTNFK